MPRIAQLVLMGVAGSGKTTLALELGRRLGCEVADADAFHPPANVAKMAAGVPLEDGDRWPWLDAIAGWIRAREAAGRTAVVTCSALKRAYRTKLRISQEVRFVYLKGTGAMMAERLRARHGHFAGEAILTSQLADLEEPEDALMVEIAKPPEEIVAEIRKALDLE